MKQTIIDEKELNVVVNHVAKRLLVHCNVNEHILKTIVKQMTMEALEAIEDQRKRGE